MTLEQELAELRAAWAAFVSKFLAALGVRRGG